MSFRCVHCQNKCTYYIRSWHLNMVIILTIDYENNVFKCVESYVCRVKYRMTVLDISCCTENKN